ncbi:MULTISPECIES: winged helix-turn-helix transcriptional regulator [Pirellulaceae]|nr:MULTISPECIES: helix-turn-helix domain-containing protein [Pirellulaceae]
MTQTSIVCFHTPPLVVVEQAGTNLWGTYFQGRLCEHKAMETTDLFEKCLGCRYMVALMRRIGEGTARPGQLERALEDISAKVLSERLKRLVEYRIVEKTAFPEIPPRVEYRLTTFGQRLLEIVDEVEQLHNKASKQADGLL